MSLADELARLAELHQRGTLSDDEFARAKARVLSPGAGDHRSPPLAAINGLRRSREERWIGGVCGGLAELSGLAAWAWRLGFVLLALCGGAGIVLYLLLWLLLPDQPAAPLGRPGGAV